MALFQVVTAESSTTSFKLSENKTKKTIVEKIKRKIRKAPENLQQWWSSPWNIMDFIALSLYFLAFGLEYYSPYVGKAIMAVDGFFWFLKISVFLRLSKMLGPYMVMIFQMVRYDLS